MSKPETDFDPFGIQQPKEDKGGDSGTTTQPPESSPNGQGQIESADSFDPFGIGSFPDKTAKKQETQQDKRNSSTETLQPPPQVSRITKPAQQGTGRTFTLPPKIMVKLTLHEEVSSIAKPGKETDGTSEVSVEGSIYAQVQCSDARKNAPFALEVAPLEKGELSVRPNPTFSKQQGRDGKTQIVNVPKQEIGYVPIAYYTVTDEVEHMPLLLERKVTVHEKSCRIAVQVRSKLTNLGDMEDFTIAVAVPERIDGSSVEILRGDGEWDELKRTIKWTLASLNKGESFMVSAQASLWKELEGDEDISFPVLMRCSSTVDHISAVDFRVVQADGHPSSINFQKTNSFRLLHRLS